MALATTHFTTSWLRTARELAFSAKAQVVAALDRGAKPIEGASPQQQRLRAAIRRNVRLGSIAALALVGGLGLWTATSNLSGAVVAAGHLVVDSNVKSVQHPQGGVVGALNVQNGSMVSAGDVLVRLDDTVARANLAIVANNLDELSARRARLMAERDNAGAVIYPEQLQARASDAQIAQLIEGENRLFVLRRQARDGQVSQLRERIAQFRQEIAGIDAQQKSKQQEISFTEVELEGMRDLWKKKLVPISRLAERERSQARLDGEDGQLTAAAAQTRGRISETELAIIQIDQDMRSEVAGELREIDAKASELRERQIAAQQSLKQIDIRAPQSGRVHQLAIHTIGGVISPGEAIMQIVPTADALVVEARVAPQDIDQVAIGQPATLRLSAFSQQTTPEVDGRVDRISPDLIEDQKAGVAYYAVRIELSAKSLEQAGPLELKPGMPTEVFLKTTDRTVLSYLLKPLTDQASRAFRGD
ncbi:HlyD family type I secretion periplasmic adaptor subunit [Mesorhizobium sp. AR10]|uniref:HlyD family type I secretion periplasmic adaptor subunit n=1 Tax=Mesorhizobium sp. AR10 TaxID=2865839 RepID=UPI00215DE641|nr:HlyD family type I secretion periplasmic adaptor subunit [Mesorhizobium sp. AR10]UVK38102.1 HlyD family type I secretion periplasmic adaptor subunit [Mesorhizobium sp. AR10]